MQVIVRKFGMSRIFIAVAFLGLVVTAVVTTLCVTLLPSPISDESETGQRYYASVSKDGTITFTELDGTEKLRIQSKVLNLTNGKLKENASVPCGYAQASISEMDRSTQDGVKVRLVL